jgi:glycosyltransferase involved in cell wall biosynthesis
VGHIKKNRNIEVLGAVQESGQAQTVLVGSTAFEASKQIYRKLWKAGCIFIDGFIQNIEELYACVDVYIFPVKFTAALPTRYDEIGVIDMPLSVLEAMAANIPVITTAIPALTRVCGPGNGLAWFDGSAEDALHQLSIVQDGMSGTRSKVKELAWPKIMERLDSIYAEVISH